MTYDAQGRLSSWTAPSGISANEYLLYDNEGNLVLTGTVTPNGNTSPIDFGVTETVLTSSTTATTNYYFVDGQRVAEQVGSTFSYLIPNLEGSPTVALSSTGTVSAVQLFLPYGAQGFAWGTMPTPHNYTDQLLDSQSGLLYYGARWYDPLADQFTSADSVQGDPSGMDPYGYVEGNPETFVDPTGQRIALCMDGGDGGNIDEGGGDGGSGGGFGSCTAGGNPGEQEPPQNRPTQNDDQDNTTQDDVNVPVDLAVQEGDIQQFREEMDARLQQEEVQEADNQPQQPSDNTSSSGQGDGNTNSDGSFDPNNQNTPQNFNRLPTEAFRGAGGTGPAGNLLTRGIIVDDGMITSGLSHFMDPVSPPVRGPWWYILEQGTEAPPGLQWVYEWQEQFRTFHIGLEPIDGPGSMTEGEYQRLVQQTLANAYQKWIKIFSYIMDP